MCRGHSRAHPGAMTLDPMIGFSIHEQRRATLEAAATRSARPRRSFRAWVRRRSSVTQGS